MGTMRQSILRRRALILISECPTEASAAPMLVRNWYARSGSLSVCWYVGGERVAEVSTAVGGLSSMLEERKVVTGTAASELAASLKERSFATKSKEKPRRRKHRPHPRITPAIFRAVLSSHPAES